MILLKTNVKLVHFYSKKCLTEKLQNEIRDSSHVLKIQHLTS